MEKNTYQLSGVDHRERGFTRQVVVARREQTYQAILRYETFHAQGPWCGDETAALRGLIQILHEQGYRQLRSQHLFRGTVYLGTQVPWVDYLDPEFERPNTPRLSWFRHWWSQLGGASPHTIPERPNPSQE